VDDVPAQKPQVPLSNKKNTPPLDRGRKLDVVAKKPLLDDEGTGKSKTKDGQHTCKQCAANAKKIPYKKGHDVGCPRRGFVAKRKVVDYVGPCRMCLAKANNTRYKKGHDTTCPKSAKYNPPKIPANVKTENRHGQHGKRHRKR
jgi:hypothetical protein